MKVGQVDEEEEEEEEEAVWVWVWVRASSSFNSNSSFSLHLPLPVIIYVSFRHTLANIKAIRFLVSLSHNSKTITILILHHPGRLIDLH